jgi:type VI secretion system protein ImpH
MGAESGLEGPDLTGDGDAVVIVDLDAARPPVAAETHADLRARLGLAERSLREEPHSFGFFQAVRLLERLFPDRARVGQFEDPGREVVRFGVSSALAFPASEIQELDIAEDGPARMRVNFFGLTGPQGVMPHAYTLLVQDRLRERDTALRDFLDLFHHRIISLFYQAWRKHQFTVAQEDRTHDRLNEHLLDLIGLGPASARGHLALPDDALIYRAGLIAPQPRGAASLQQLIEDFFDVTAVVEQFAGGWYGVSAQDRCAVGGAEDAGNRLGGAVVGDEIRDTQARVRVRLGPLTRERYDEFLPGGTGYRELASMLRFYSHDQFEFEVQLILSAEDVPGVRLGDGTEDPRLGWSTWIRSTERAIDSDETLLTLDPKAA